MAEFNIGEIYRNAFGYEAPPSFNLEKAPKRRKISSLGQQYYSEPNDDLYEREFFLPVWIDDYLLPFAVMGMAWKKTIVTTPMPDRNGSVHELICVDDYVFNIKGILVNEDGNFPEQQIISLHDIFKINGSVRLRSALSAIVLNAEETEERVVIKDVKWPPTPGVENVRAFEIECESDIKYLLKEKKMFVLNSDISIGKYIEVKPIEVKINKSIYSFVDTAMIKLPTTSRVERAGEPITFVDTAKKFKEGDVVVIKLGYNGDLVEEFFGFVSRVSISSPVDIACEGFSYLLRKETYTKTFYNTELREILKFLTNGTPITLDEENIPKFPLNKVVFNNDNGIQALEKIKETSLGALSIFFKGPVLYAGLQYTKALYDVKYRMGYNVIKDNGLKLREIGNDNYEVHVTVKKKDGTNEKVIATGKKAGGRVVKFTTHAITDRNALKQVAETKLSQLSYSGYEGKMTTFLQPFCEPGCRVMLEDQKFPERSGNYICDSVEVTYGTNGARRILGIGHKL